jgi:hypothetical protein
MNEARGVSVVMVAYNTGPSLFEAIPRVLAEPLVDELVLVDNGSMPEDAARLRDLAGREPRLRLLQGHGNIGFARGCNLGAREAQGRHFIILNPDAYLQPSCVAALIEGAKGFASPCIVGARVLNTDGSEQRGARRGEVTPLTTVLSFSRLPALLPFLRRFEIHHDDRAAPEGPVPTPTISGACFYMSREDFWRIGGFDERYFLHVEDIDLCWRARKAGGSVVFQPLAVVLHEGSTSGKHAIKVEYHKGRGLVRYFLKRAETAPALALAAALSPLIMLACVVRPALKALFGPARGRLN